MDLAPKMGRMSSFRARASVEWIGSLLVFADLDQVRVSSPSETAAEYLVDGH